MAGMRQVLFEADANGKAFSVASGTTSMTSFNLNLLSRQMVILEDHAGGTWKMQFRRVGQNAWLDVGDSVVNFTDNGIVTVFTTAELEYRLNGGTAGANAWCTNVEWVKA